MKVNTLPINVKFIDGSKQLILNISSEWRYSRQCNKEKLKAWTSRTSLGKEIDVSKTILKILRTFPKPSL
jgi:hypothetical protein